MLLTVFLIVVMLGIIAFAVDFGYIVMARTQLQVAADAAVLAAASSIQDDPIAKAQDIGARNKVGSQPVQILAADVVKGTWDKDTRTFSPFADQSQLGNAVKVTARADQSTRPVPLFFASIFNKHSMNVTAEAVATTNPRDICFVVDLSTSMNNDTNPGCISGHSSTYGGVDTDTLLQRICDDLFSSDSYSSSKNWPIGGGASQRYFGSSKSITTFADLSEKNGPLYNLPRSSPYYPYSISKSDLNRSSGIVSKEYSGGRYVTSTLTNSEKKACQWLMDVEVPDVMPNVKPVPDSGSNASIAYWYSYFDFTRQNISYKSSWSSKIGYESYIAFLMANGRDRMPDGNIYTPMACNDGNPHCIMNTDPDPIEGVSSALDLRFPAREMPTHAARRAIIAAIQVIWDRNINTPEYLRDHVSVISFDTDTGTRVRHPLDGDYEQAMRDTAKIQATHFQTPEDTYSVNTATAYGLMTAINYLQSSAARPNANKVVILLTDGIPNVYNPSWGISTQVPHEYNNLDWHNNAKDASLVEAIAINAKKWLFYPVGLGYDCDNNFMDHMYSVSQGKNDPSLTCPYSGGGDPYQMESKLRDSLIKIISNPKLRLVQ
ncbi:MAG: VWA domain-containing protein [Pirellulales bacterium]|nr:VWA domain-containing protein [Pirellulales bacterium]